MILSYEVVCSKCGHEELEIGESIIENYPLFKCEKCNHFMCGIGKTDYSMRVEKCLNLSA